MDEDIDLSTTTSIPNNIANNDGKVFICIQRILISFSICLILTITIISCVFIWNRSYIMRMNINDSIQISNPLIKGVLLNGLKWSVYKVKCGHM